MSTKTRRRLMWVLVLAAVTLPPELLVLNAINNSGTSLPARWVNHLTTEELANAATNIHTYAVEVRVELLKALSPASRAAVWQNVGRAYLASHAELSSEQAAAIRHALALATPEVFSSPSKTVLAELQARSEGVRQMLGEPAYAELFRTVGPLQSRAASMPLWLRLEGFVRKHVLASAASPSLPCNCYTDNAVDCVTSGPPYFYCSELQGCGFSYWGCGTWYMEPCNGYCIPMPAELK